VGQYVKEVMKLAGDERDAIAEKNRRIADRVFEHVDDPTKTLVVPKPEKAAPFLNFAPLQNALARLDEVLVQISSVEIFRICEFCRLAQAARTADQIAGAVADRLANFPILN
jgi:hypothetical protein